MQLKNIKLDLMKRDQVLIIRAMKNLKKVIQKEQTREKESNSIRIREAHNRSKVIRMLAKL